MRTTTALGFDPAFRHGVLLKALFEFGDHNKDRIIATKSIYSWGRKGDGISFKDKTTDIFKFANTIIDKLPSEEGKTRFPIGIDWEPQSVYWRATKVQVVQMSLFLGYLSRGFMALGYPTVFITPGTVREFFGLKSRRAEKEAVHECFLSHVELVPEVKAKLNVSKQRAGDYLDSLILAYIMSKATEAEKRFYELEPF